MDGLTPAVKAAMDRVQRAIDLGNLAMADDLAILEDAYERAELDPPKPGHVWTRITAHGTSSWMETPIGWRPEPVNRPPRPPANITRTVNNPHPLTWKDMDRRTSYRTGCPWHTCPNCTTYAITEHKAVRRPYEAATGDPITGDINLWMAEHRKLPSDIEWLTDQIIHKDQVEYLRNGAPKPVTGMNLRRYYSDGHEECADCGWKGEPKALSNKPKRSNLPNKATILAKVMRAQIRKSKVPTERPTRGETTGRELKRDNRAEVMAAKEVMKRMMERRAK